MLSPGVEVVAQKRCRPWRQLVHNKCGRFLYSFLRAMAAAVEISLVRRRYAA
jgi:hypothetical protein